MAVAEAIVTKKNKANSVRRTHRNYKTLCHIIIAQNGLCKTEEHKMANDFAEIEIYYRILN